MSADEQKVALDIAWREGFNAGRVTQAENYAAREVPISKQATHTLRCPACDATIKAFCINYALAAKPPTLKKQVEYIDRLERRRDWLRSRVSVYSGTDPSHDKAELSALEWAISTLVDTLPALDSHPEEASNGNQ